MIKYYTMSSNNIQIISSEPGYVAVRNNTIGLERMYRLTVHGDALCVGRTGTNAGITKSALTTMDALAETHFKEVAKVTPKAKK